MNPRVISLYLSVSLMLLAAGCAGKSVSSSSGDQSGRAKAETVQPDAIKTVPLERSLDRPAGSVPSNRVLEPSAMSDTSALGDVFFDYDRFQIRKDAMPLLDANAGWLRANGSKTVLIEGHCDERGTVAYNLVLGEKRARAAKQYLQDLGVPTSQLQITSYGEARPFCKQQNEDCYQQNRRAHFVAK
ncbi:MAG TPA: peptidoglycan-associated lipoprotein Pal [Nitrospiraceae bacterium]|nr:peptidoglycan-associated lipoprotein Pal [Nitrospiraceae bacterium]